MKKRKQHYVWRHYLRSWVDDEKLSCLRENKIFTADLMGLANERDFYRVKELTKEENEFIKKVVIEHSPDILKGIHLNFLNGFTEVFSMRNALRRNGLADDEIERKIDELINNLEEDYHSKIEENSIKYIDAILSKDIQFFETEEGRGEFLYYLCIQFIRTKKTKANAIRATNYQTKVNTENIWNVLSHIFATNIAFFINRQPDFKLILLNNLTKIPFITSDQPVINTFAVGKNIGDPVDELELYYPISSTIGLLITKKYQNSKNNQNDISDDKQIEQYNSYIVTESHEQIYSNSEQVLQDILSKKT